MEFVSHRNSCVEIQVPKVMVWRVGGPWEVIWLGGGALRNGIHVLVKRYKRTWILSFSLLAKKMYSSYYGLVTNYTKTQMVKYDNRNLGQIFREDKARMACLCSVVFVGSPGRQTGWGLETSKGSLFTCLEIDAGGLSWALLEPFQMISPHSLVWISSQHGSWVLRIKLREWERKMVSLLLPQCVKTVAKSWSEEGK